MTIFFCKLFVPKLLQNVLTGKHEGCGHDSSLDVQSDLAHSGVHLFLASNEDKEFQLPASGNYWKIQISVKKSGVHLFCFVLQDRLSKRPTMVNWPMVMIPRVRLDSCPGWPRPRWSTITTTRPRSCQWPWRPRACVPSSLVSWLAFSWPGDAAALPGTKTIPTTCLTSTS